MNNDDKSTEVLNERIFNHLKMRLRELYGVINPILKEDAERRKVLMKGRRLCNDRDVSFDAFAVGHYWNMIINEIEQINGIRK